MTNETLADILDEIRSDEAASVLTTGLLAHEMKQQLNFWADRIEAAAQREKVEAVTIAATKAVNLTDEKWRRDAGNAAALREALVKTLDAFKSGAIRTEWNDPDSWKHDDELWYLKNDIESALDAPARNCDRFRTADEVSAYWGANVHAVPLHGDAYGMHIDGETYPTFLDWLFATAEGGEK